MIRLAQEHDRDPGESVYAHLARRTGVTASQSRLDAATAALEKSDKRGRRIRRGVRRMARPRRR